MNQPAPNRASLAAGIGCFAFLLLGGSLLGSWWVGSQMNAPIHQCITTTSDFGNSVTCINSKP